jgi:hypothetical protein
MLIAKDVAAGAHGRLGLVVATIQMAAARARFSVRTRGGVRRVALRALGVRG